jgi:hypothetical protein
MGKRVREVEAPVPRHVDRARRETEERERDDEPEPGDAEESERVMVGRMRHEVGDGRAGGRR